MHRSAATPESPKALHRQRLWARCYSISVCFSERAAILEDLFNECFVCRAELESVLENIKRLIPVLAFAPASIVEINHLILGDAKLVQAGLILFAPFEDSFAVDNLAHAASLRRSSVSIKNQRKAMAWN